MLEIHLGRRILNLPLAANRADFLPKPDPQKPARIVAGYEKILGAVLSAPPEKRSAMWEEHDSSLSNYFSEYTEAAAMVKNRPRASIVAETYEQILGASRETIMSDAEKTLGLFSPAGEQFSPYVDALVELARGGEIVALINEFAPRWQSNLGYSKLGCAAARGGHTLLAEELLLKLKPEVATWNAAKSMGILAEMWHRSGDVAKAREHMIECMRLILSAAKAGRTVRFLDHEESYQRLRQDFLRIFGETNSLAAAKLPATTR